MPTGKTNDAPFKTPFCTGRHYRHSSLNKLMTIHKLICLVVGCAPFLLSGVVIIQGTVKEVQREYVAHPDTIAREVAEKKAEQAKKREVNRLLDEAEALTGNRYNIVVK